jgi:hypothetical protein
MWLIVAAFMAALLAVCLYDRRSAPSTMYEVFTENERKHRNKVDRRA